MDVLKCCRKLSGLKVDYDRPKNAVMASIRPEILLQKLESSGTGKDADHGLGRPTIPPLEEPCSRYTFNNIPIL